MTTTIFCLKVFEKLKQIIVRVKARKLYFFYLYFLHRIESYKRSLRMKAIEKVQLLDLLDIQYNRYEHISWKESVDIIIFGKWKTREKYSKPIF